MPHIPKEHIALFSDRIAMMNEVQLSAAVIFEIFREAAQYQSMRVTLENISATNGHAAEWAKGALDRDDKSRARMKLKNPGRLITLEAVRTTSPSSPTPNRHATGHWLRFKHPTMNGLA